jgi:Na+-driven multidrug efflux pump
MSDICADECLRLSISVKLTLPSRCFCHLYQGLGMGGILASSEWIYWETLSLMIGTFGVIPLSVHTIPTQLIMVTFMGPLSLGIALSIRLGATLPVSVARAKQTVIDSFICSVVVFGLLTYLMYLKQDAIVRIFTTSNAVVEGCHEIWWKVCTFNFLLAIYGVFMGVCIGLGMQWTLGIATVATLWLVGLPMAYYLSVVQGGGINAAWSSVWPPYVVIVLSLTIAVVRADWNQIADDIRIREGAELLIRRPSSVASDDAIKNSRLDGSFLFEHKRYGAA